MWSPDASLELLPLARLPLRAREPAVRQLAARMLPARVAEREVEAVEDVVFLLGQLVRERLERAAEPDAAPYPAE